MLDLVGVALAVGLLVMRHVLHLVGVGITWNTAVEIPVAHFGAQLQAALAHVARIERRVVIRSDVPVIRNRQIQTAARRGCQERMQEPRLPLVIQGESGHRRIKDRNILEPHRRILRCADLAVVIEVHFGRAHVPVPVSRLAGRERAIEESYLVFALKLRPLGRSAGQRGAGVWRRGRQPVVVGNPQHHRRVGNYGIRTGDRDDRHQFLLGIEATGNLLDDQIVGILGKADLFGHLHADMRRGELGAFLKHAHVAGRVHFVIERPVDDLVPVELGARLAQLDIACRHGHVIGAPFEVVGDDEQRIVVILLRLERIRDPDLRHDRLLLAAQHIEPALAAQAQWKIIAKRIAAARHRVTARRRVFSDAGGSQLHAAGILGRMPGRHRGEHAARNIGKRITDRIRHLTGKWRSRCDVRREGRRPSVKIGHFTTNRRPS